MLVLITNTIVPYCYDIAHVLGLPRNLSHRFRYLKRWIHPSVQIDKLKGQNGAIILRNSRTGEFVPIRRVTVESVLTVGDINYIEFRLGDFITEPEEANVKRAIQSALNTLGFGNEGGRDLECLVFHVEGGSQDAVDKNGDEHAIWSRILKKIGQFKCYKDFGFLKIERIRDSNGEIAFTRQDETGKHAFALEPSHLYFVDVIQHVPWEVEKDESIETPYDVELKAEKDEVILIRRIQRVVGKYDLLQFAFKTPAGYAKKHSFLELENKQGGEIAKFGLPALFLPIIVEPPSWMKILRLASYAVATLAIVGTVAAEPLGRYFLLGADGVRGIALFLLVLTTQKWDEFVTGFIKDTKDFRLKNEY